ncbi:MAG: hypothetical protein Q9160_001157 [Pyrenula sp. 1 TL-2023]
MSFLYRASTVATSSGRCSFKAFSTTSFKPKSAPDTTKDTLRQADRKVSDAAVSGIDAGANAAQKAKEAVGVGAKKAEGNAAEATGKAKGTAAELSGKAKGKVEETKGKL